MKASRKFKVSHERGAVFAVLSDPTFVIPRLFPSVKEFSAMGTSFSGHGSFAFRKFELSGTVFKGDEIRYVFQVRSGDVGTGRLVFQYEANLVTMSLEYEGVFERLFGLMTADRWIDEFIKNIDEEIRLERIKRKI
ncbi:DUF3211 domain-containing protein [Metallosphaera hakonensis]|uniref:DUF3211 domain-containing protein n=1 Tax=Metallosphaera hakonensis JCM 8857 = DSM 7519 TaxID=1293036 RepID=A0A2U9IWE7_9CREN|nr:DUF3211 domain-containing protein [Metallosphaera hakonensis]AWS00369.1 DUF3211 domain-containing protein [Metallosphaera hakonensis JCM 8857 = DSM 7519]